MAKKAEEIIGKVADAGSVLGAIVSTTIIQHSAKKFVVKDNFKVGVNEEAQVEIFYLGGNFKKWFLEKTEEPNPDPNGTVYGCLLRKSSVDSFILSELGGQEKAETTMAEIYAMMECQANGKSGDLLNNGWPNIFYVRDITGTLRAMDVRWSDVGWHVDAFSIDNPFEWDSNSQVFSHNSLVPQAA